MTSFDGNARSADRRLADELGIPAGAYIRRDVIDPARLMGRLADPPPRPEWDGYNLELFGVVLFSEPPADAPWPFVRLPWILQLWQEIVRYGNSPIYGRIRWNPDDGERVSIHGLEAHHNADDIKRIRRGLARWREIRQSNAGRKPSSIHEDTKRRGTLERVIKQYWNSRRPGYSRNPISWEHAAQMEGTSYKSCRRWSEKFGIPMNHE